MDFSFLSFLLGLAAGAAVLMAALLPYILRLERARARAGADGAVMEAQFQAAAIKALQTSGEQFLALAQEKLSGVQKDAAFDLEKRQKAIEGIVDPIGKTLKEVETRLEQMGAAGAVLESQLKTFAEDGQALRAQTAALVQVLKNSSARGRWGELQLSRTLELVGMVENIHFQQQFSSRGDEGVGQRPDFIVHIPGGLSVVIDVKTPLEPYWALSDSDHPQVSEDQIKSFRDHVRGHVKQLSSKEYWRQFSSPQFVVMFLPTEGLFSLAVQADKTLIEDAAASNVILASPTTILGLLRVIMHAWQQQALADNARKIGQMASDLNARMGTFFDHLQKVGRNLGAAVNAYNAAAASAESRIMPQLRKIEEYQGAGSSQFEALAQLDHTPRDLALPEPALPKVTDDKAA